MVHIGPVRLRIARHEIDQARAGTQLHQPDFLQTPFLLAA